MGTGALTLAGDVAFWKSRRLLSCIPFQEEEAMASKGQMTGMRGVYLVAAELASRGFIVSLTSRSAAGADLLVTNHDCNRAFSVQVKTNGAYFYFFLFGKHARKLNAPSHKYVLVNLKPKGTEFFVVPSSFVARSLKTYKRSKSTWYAIQVNELGKFKGRWSAFGKPV